MNPNLMLGVFVGAAMILAIAIGVYALVVLPEISEYNDHLATIREQAERCNCSAITVQVYPDYYVPEAR